MVDPPLEAPGERLITLWRRWRVLPLGHALFGLALRAQVPYSGALGARVVELEPGHARLELRERRAIRNHLRSIHAVALANLGELTSGLAMTSALPRGVRAIVLGLDVGYSKKARGVITAESRVTLPPITGATDLAVEAVMHDATGAEVARLSARWRVEPR